MTNLEVFLLGVVVVLSTGIAVYRTRWRVALRECLKMADREGKTAQERRNLFRNGLMAMYDNARLRVKCGEPAFRLFTIEDYRKALEEPDPEERQHKITEGFSAHFIRRFGPASMSRLEIAVNRRFGGEPRLECPDHPGACVWFFSPGSPPSVCYNCQRPKSEHKPWVGADADVGYIARDAELQAVADSIQACAAELCGKQCAGDRPCMQHVGHEGACSPEFEE